MVANRRMLYYYYDDESFRIRLAVSITCATIAFISLVFLINACRRKQAAAALIELHERAVREEEESEAQESIRRSQTVPTRNTPSYPQFASSTGPNRTSSAPNHGVIHISSMFDDYNPARTPFTRTQIELMTPGELRVLGERLQMGQMGSLPRNEFIDLALAVQSSLGEQSSTSSASKPPTHPADNNRTLNPSVSMSSRNLATGIMECGVCTFSMGGASDKMMAALPCGHAYCFDCLNAMEKCPTCRKDYRSDQIIRIYSA